MKMETNQNTKTHLSKEIWIEGIDAPSYGFQIIAASCVFFYILSKINLMLIPKSAQSSQWRWKNTSLSFVHSVITSVWAVYCFYERPDMAEDLITIFTLVSQSLPPFSVGYFLYDMLDMLINHRSRQTYELLGHHFVTIFCFMTAITTRHYIGFAVVSLLAELNSIFLHTRQLLQICKVNRQSLLYRINSIINLGTFIPFRIMLFSWMTRWLVINKDHVPFAFYTIGSVGLAIMAVMNIILFYRLFHSEFMSFKDKGADKVSKSD